METGKIALGLVGLWWLFCSIALDPEQVLFRFLAYVYLSIWVGLETIPPVADWFASNERKRDD